MRGGHLDSDGFQCRNKARGRFLYFGNSEMEYRHYDDRDTTWVVVPFCKKHQEDRRQYNPKEYKRRNRETGYYDKG